MAAAGLLEEPGLQILSSTPDDIEERDALASQPRRGDLRDSAKLFWRPKAVTHALSDASERTSGVIEDRSYEVPVVRRRKPKGPPARDFKIRQKWEAVITDIEGDSIWAKLEDLTNPDLPVEIAEFPRDELLRKCPEDADLLTVGSVFYWMLGVHTTPQGIRKVSEIRFRRVPRLSPRAIEALRSEARSLLARFRPNV